jgi:ubiquinone/menaquinone biosynthesis C-methylase UbiE
MLTRIKRNLIERYNRRALRDGSTWPSGSYDRITEEVEDTLRELASPQPQDTVLDIGIGRRGRYLTLMGERSSMAIGIDISEITVNVAKEYIGQKYLGCPWNLMVASADALPFSDRSFTLVICSEMLEYYPLADCENILREIHRVLKYEGRTVVDFPDSEDNRVWQLKESEEQDGVSFFVYTEETIMQTINCSGFTIAKKQKADVEIQYLLQRQIY